MKNSFGKLHDAFAAAVPSTTKAGHQRIEMDEMTLMPKAGGAKPQTPAQHAAVTKAAQASRTKRKIAAGLPLVGTPPKGGF